MIALLLGIQNLMPKAHSPRRQVLCPALQDWVQSNLGDNTRGRKAAIAQRFDVVLRPIGSALGNLAASPRTRLLAQAGVPSGVCHTPSWGCDVRDLLPDTDLEQQLHGPLVQIGSLGVEGGIREAFE